MQNRKIGIFWSGLLSQVVSLKGGLIKQGLLLSDYLF